MAKILIGPGGDGGTYTFNKVAKTVTITLPNNKKPSLESLLLITDVANNVMIYNFADPTKGATLSGNTFTLDYDTNTGAFNNNDPLQIHYYYTELPSISIDDLAVILKAYLSHSNKTAEVINGAAKVTMIEGLLNLVSMVSTVSTVSVITNPGFRPVEDLFSPQLAANYYNQVRTKIT